jgi:hypothetical protein
MQVVGRNGHAIEREKGIALCMMMVGCVEAVFWTGSAEPSRAIERVIIGGRTSCSLGCVAITNPS